PRGRLRRGQRRDRRCPAEPRAAARAEGEVGGRLERAAGAGHGETYSTPPRKRGQMTARRRIVTARPPRGPEASMANSVILVTGCEPFGTHTVNPSADVAKAVGGHRVEGFQIESAVLPVHHAETATRARALLADLAPEAVLHLGLAEGRARLA